MARVMIIDGNNLIHSDRNHLFGPASSGFDTLRKGVISVCERVKHVLCERLVVVFDGRMANRDAAAMSELVEVIFAAPDLTADTVIERMVASYENPSETLVVTSDRAVERNVLATGGQVVSCEDFLDEAALAMQRIEGNIAKASKTIPRPTLGDFFP